MATIRTITRHVDCQGHRVRRQGVVRTVFKKGHDVKVDSLGRVTIKANEKIGRKDWDAIVGEVTAIRTKLRVRGTV